MYIWDDGESVTVTGSVNQEVLGAYKKAKAEGGDLSEFAPYLAESSAEAAVPPESGLEVAEESAAPAPAEEAPPAEANAYDGWSLAELQDEAKSHGLPTYGTKAEIAARLSESGTDEGQ